MSPKIQKDLISIILPVWKPDLNQLKACVDSVLSQTYSNIEVIISYKKSQEFDDAFYRLIKKYGDAKIKVIENNGGLSDQLNAGIMQSKGEFIARIDDDDFCAVDRFEKQLKFKKNHKCNVVGSYANYISNDGKKIAKIQVPMTHQEIRKVMMLRNPILGITVLMERSMLDEIGLYDPSFIFSADYELWFRVMYRGYKFGNVPEYLASIRDSPNSISRGSTWRKARIQAIKAKNKALLHYGFIKPRDIFYYCLTTLIYFISPRLLMRINKITGWYKSKD